MTICTRIRDLCVEGKDAALDAFEWLFGDPAYDTESPEYMARVNAEDRFKANDAMRRRMLAEIAEEEGE